MNRWEKWSLHFVALLVTGTGLAYFCFKYLLRTKDPFQVINHPLQPLMLELHILAAPPLIFLLGWILRTHILEQLQSGNRANRRSGMLALILFPLMVASGYGLQIFTQPLLFRATLVLHLATSTLFAVSYLVHQVITLGQAARKSSRRRRVRRYGLARWLGRAA